MAVVRITEYKSRDVVTLLREALGMALKGQIRGVCLAMKFDDSHHGITLAGEYSDDPTDVLAVTSRIAFEVNLLVRERHGDESGAA
jgi:hypothetical protein